MKFHTLGTAASVVACLATLLPASILSAAFSTERIADISLGNESLLMGQVVDPQGIAQPNTPVSIRYVGKEVAHTTTDANGVFAAKGLRGGQYEILTPQGGIACRLWTTDTAPPSAQSAALVVSGDQVVRGQRPGCGDACAPGPYYNQKPGVIGWMKSHPFITGSAIAAAIAVPIAVANDDSDSGS